METAAITDMKHEKGAPVPGDGNIAVYRCLTPGYLICLFQLIDAFCSKIQINKIK